MEASGVTVVTGDGNRQVFDGVVMTTPLGWLKRNKAAFMPGLGRRLLNAIDSISVGHLEKVSALPANISQAKKPMPCQVYVKFPRAYWKGWHTHPTQHSTTPATSIGSEDDFPGYTNWISPSYAASTNPNAWPQEAYNLAAFAAPHSHPTLLFYMYGEQSAYITNLVQGMSTSEHLETLSAFFHPYYSLLPHYVEGDPGCQPSAILSTEWNSDELAGFGSYCNFQVGMTDADGDVEALRHGCPERKMWFAGEHAAPFDELGTAAGAYLSGEGVAKNVALAFGRFCGSANLDNLATT
jgi:hypothetical protein